MAKRSAFTIGVAFGIAMAGSPIAAQTTPRINVAYENASLSRVMGDFARFSGHAIAVASNVRDRTITATLRNVDWSTALDFILEQNALILRAEANGAFRVEKQQLLTVQYENAPLSRVVRDMSLFSRRAITLSPDVGNPSITYGARNKDWERALDELLAQNGLVAQPDAKGILRVTRRP